MEYRSIQILVVEDNPVDVQITISGLRDARILNEVHVAEDGAQALQFLKREGQYRDAPRPDIVFLDLNLPKVEGFEVLRRLRESKRLSEIPVLIVSSSDSPEDRGAAVALGAGDFRKSTSYDEFLTLGAVLKKLLEANGLV